MAVALFRTIILLPLLTMFGTAASASGSANTGTIASVGIPSGFEDFSRERDLLVDVYFGSRKVGEARASARPGFIRFKDPTQILDLLDKVERSPELLSALGAELPANTKLVCTGSSSHACESLDPEIVGVIFDEEHFRVDLFVNRKWLKLVRPEDDLFLVSPTSPLSATSAVGFALSGSGENSPVYNFQNRTIVGFRNARLRSDGSYASKYGFVMDSLVGELDRPNLRYSAGLFWAPGLDLTGQRRIMGVGVSTQFDTRTDRDRIRGTPLVLFLSQPAQVDILVDGRLVTSRSYEAGNNILDIAGMPDGSYPIVLRIHGENGSVRDEQRFFSKNQQIAPVGQPIYYAYAGLLSNTRRGHPISFSSDIFYQFGNARRINERVAVDLSVIGTKKKAIVEAGTWLISSFGRMRVAGLFSSSGDRGALLQFASAETGRVNINFDLRRVWSKGGPLIPLSDYVDTFSSTPPNGRQIGAGSYTQASGSIGYRLGVAYLAVIGSLRKDEGARADYSIGPSLNWPIVNFKGLQIALQSDGQLTRQTTAGYVGIRLFYTSASYSLSSRAGQRSISSKGNSRRSSWLAVGDTTAHFAYDDDDGTSLSAAAGISRELDSATAHAEALLYSRLGTARSEVLHDFEGNKRTRYALSFQTGAVLNREEIALGGRNQTESALVVSVDGARGLAKFDILVDDQPRGRLSTSERVPIFLQPYRAYSVRLRPVDAASVWFDTAAREITLYPGNVQPLRWKAEHLLTVFGRAVRADGTPVKDALVTSRRGTGQSNSDGYFQIDVSGADLLSFTKGSEEICRVTLDESDQQLDFASLGRVVCR